MVANPQDHPRFQAVFVGLARSVPARTLLDVVVAFCPMESFATTSSSATQTLHCNVYDNSLKKHLVLLSMHDLYMRMAYGQAEAALAEDEVPVGAVIVRGERVIAAAHNQREQLHDPTAHAEMIAITQAAESLQDWRLEGCTLYVTLEPCIMCAGAILQARIPLVVYGATDPKAGALHTLYQLLSDPRLNHRAQVVPGVLARECSEILTRFFTAQRRLGKK